MPLPTHSERPDITLRPARAADAELFYAVVDRTMRTFVLETWGAWDEARVRRESIEKSEDPNVQVIEVSETPAGIFCELIETF